MVWWHGHCFGSGIGLGICQWSTLQKFCWCWIQNFCLIEQLRIPLCPHSTPSLYSTPSWTFGIIFGKLKVAAKDHYVWWSINLATATQHIKLYFSYTHMFFFVNKTSLKTQKLQNTKTCVHPTLLSPMYIYIELYADHRFQRTRSWETKTDLHLTKNKDCYHKIKIVADNRQSYVITR